MQLYASVASPFARKIRILLIEKGVPFETRMLDLWNSSDLNNLNPLGKAPTLVLDDGRVLYDSPVVADYVDGRWPSPRFIPEDFEGRIAVKQWESLVDGMAEAVAAVLFENRFHEEGMRSQPWIDRQTGKYERALAEMERLLGTREWCVGGAMTLADITVGAMLGFISLRAAHVLAGGRYPNLLRLSTRLEARPSFRKTAPPPA